MRAMSQLAVAAACLVLLAGCATTGTPEVSLRADTILLGKHIVTMDTTRVDAVALRGETSPRPDRAPR